ncbi:MAG: sulfatase, partial [Candidatus Poribacteria bacterium]
VANQTIACLRRLEKSPFMITCSFNYPHDPNEIPSPYYEMFPPEAIQLPDNFGSREARFEKEWSRQIVTDLGEAGVREFLRLYYGAVKLIDDQVGRILDALEAAGRSENTIIIFTADHGDMAGGHGMVWKSTSSFYDEVVRAPLIIRYPAQVKPGKTDIAAGLTDVMPTLLDFAGHPIPDHVQGYNLAPYLRGERETGIPDYTFCERVRPNPERTRTITDDTTASFMVRGRGWKYIRYSNGEEFLYDLMNDPGETRNLAGEESFQESKIELRRELGAWLLATGYPDSN